VAAQQVGVTPSALSQGLAELERRVGVPLFERQGRRRVLAPSARQVLDHAEAVVSRTRDLARWAARRREGSAGQLRLGMIDVAAVHHYPDVLAGFRAARPDVELRLTVAPSADLLADLGRAVLDLVVCVEPPGPLDGIAWSPLRTEPLAVYAPPEVRRAGPASRWGPWVTVPAGSHTRRVIATALAGAGARFDVVAESHQPEVLREMVRLGLGWTVLPVPQAETGDRPLRPARSTPLVERRLVLATRLDAVVDATAQALAESLRTS
jgi:DNA-binding transcriptional LysR family regulator